MWMAGPCSASLALQVPVTHADSSSRPQRSLAPPPRRRCRGGQTHRRAPTKVAGNEHVGHSGREGEVGEGGGQKPGERRNSRGLRVCGLGSESHAAAWGDQPDAPSTPRLMFLVPKGRGERGAGVRQPFSSPRDRGQWRTSALRSVQSEGGGSQGRAQRRARALESGDARGTRRLYVPAAPRHVLRPFPPASSERKCPQHACVKPLDPG
ncbi:uncharacterized protein PS065_006526 [Dugong dugon]